MGIALLVLVVGFVMMGVEAWRPGQAWPKVAGWWPRAIALNAVQVAAVFLAGKAWNGWMLRHRPWNADGLGVVIGGILGYLAITFVYYWWHRWRHEVGFLWRWFHQVHHSPQRIEIVTSFYKHPIGEDAVHHDLGTFRNPRAWSARSRFGPEGEHRLLAMLRGVDLHAPSIAPKGPSA